MLSICILSCLNQPLKNKRQGDNGEAVNIVVQQTSHDNSTCLSQKY